TVLANDEIINGLSERGGHPVIRKKMTQWSMRISAYAERLLQGLETIDWSESIKESQRNWIGKSVGARVEFRVLSIAKTSIEVFTTRPDTIFGVTFMTLAPEHELVELITTSEQKSAVKAYIEKTAKRSERERMADVKTISGVFTGAFAEHPFTKESIPVWIGDYVLAGYGTGAVMAVPCGDERDFAFANFFKGTVGMHVVKNIICPLASKGGTEIQSTENEILEEAFISKEGFVLKNSDFLDGLDYKEGTKKVIHELEKINQGSGKTNYRLRDAVFSRQRYWGEPFPVYYVNRLPQLIDAKYLPIKLPEVEKYLPTEDGQPPLGNATNWAWNTETNKIVSCELIDNISIFQMEMNTMPGWAGSSWYWLRYMDAKNENEIASSEAIKYWESVDLYIGGSEHATGHLLYARFWNKFLKDKGFAPTEEPFKKLINQGMILGMSAFVYKLRLNFRPNPNTGWNSISYNVLVSNDLRKKLEDNYKKLSEVNNNLFNEIEAVFNKEFESHEYKNSKNTERSIGFDQFHVDLSVINDVTNELDIEEFRNHPLYSDYKNAEFILEDGSLYVAGSSPSGMSGRTFMVGREVEKMSKSKYNVVNPDNICNEYGADTLRLYEMFLGPLEQSKPWNTAGISGVFGFLKKLWRLYFDENGLVVTDNEPSKDSYRSLHKTIKKCTDDIEKFSFNTSVSQFMICVNELQAQNCHEQLILEPLLVLISPYAPHIAEELWKQLGHTESIVNVDFPICNEAYLVESDKEYPVSFNGKMRFTISLPLDLSPKQIEEIIMNDERTIKQLEGNIPKKVIIVPGKVINMVV
ncbi:class I tRNA ligase family protein, partial [Flavobacterium sp.]|uniref:class I tRNA ligase family protein n=1 Tax=Flavobacterium sp. TaxID=239 RepID=UPI003750B4A4